MQQKETIDAWNLVETWTLRYRVKKGHGQLKFSPFQDCCAAANETE